MHELLERDVDEDGGRIGPNDAWVDTLESEPVLARAGGVRTVGQRRRADHDHQHHDDDDVDRWEYGAAFVTITPSGGINASTYNSNSFNVRNDSAGGVSITQAKIDFSTAIFPDMVYDPAGWRATRRRSASRPTPAR